MDLLISSLFPGHEAVLKTDVVPVSQLHLKPVHGVLIMDHILLPNLESTVLQVTVAEVELPEVVEFGTLSSVVDQTVTTVLKVLFLWDFNEELIPSGFKLALDVEVLDSIKYLLE